MSVEKVSDEINLTSALTNGDGEREKNVDCDDTDISFCPSPVALALRRQLIAEALVDLKEKESFARLNLMQSYHDCFCHIVRQSLLSLRRYSTIINAVYAQQPVTKPQSAGYQTSYNQGPNKSAVKRSSGRRKSLLLSSMLNAGDAVKNVEETNARQFWSFYENNVRRMSKELHAQRQLVCAFAKNEMRRENAVRNRAAFLALRARQSSSRHDAPATPVPKPQNTPVHEQLTKNERPQNAVNAWRSRMAPRVEARQQSFLYREKTQALLKERCAFFQKDMEGLRHAAALMHEMANGNFVKGTNDVAFITACLRPEDLKGEFLSQKLGHKSGSVLQIDEDKYKKYCGTRVAAVRSLLTVL